MIPLTHLKTSLFGLGFTLILSACAGSGGSDSGGNPSSTATSSSTPASSSSQPASSLAASSSVGSSTPSPSSSSSSSLPTHASNGTIYCTSAGDDPDGDGWGWENEASCVVRNSAADPDKGDFEGCIIGTLSWQYCTVDNASWGYEAGAVCVSQSFCPANRSATQTAMAEDLSNPASSEKAEAVYDYFRSVWGTKTLSGQQDLTWQDSIDMYQRVLDDTGKAPAIMGYDFMNYAFTSGDGLQQTEEAIEHWDRSGLVSFAWHGRDPSDTTSAFYSAETDFQIPIADGQLNTQDPNFTRMQADIDSIAAELQTLQDAGVVVLWRPLHEASGGWFWWGRSRSDGISPAYAQVVLWRYIYERMVNHHGLTNLLWVWNGQSAGWYPGDAYVDIVSQDIYDGEQNYESQIDTYNAVKAFPLQSKLVALSENSNIPDPDNIAEDGAWWLWFMVWNDSNTDAGVTSSNNFWTGEYYNTNAHKLKVYNHDNVITLDELPDF